MTWEHQEEIRRLRASGEGYKRIAAMLGLSVNTVKSVCQRENVKQETGCPDDTTAKSCVYTSRENVTSESPSAFGAESPSYRPLAGGNGSIAQMRAGWDAGEARQSPWARFAAAPDVGRCCWGMTEAGYIAVMPVILPIASDPIRGERHAG